jgi:hypothetical protein
LRKLENYEKKAAVGKRVGKLPIAPTMVMKPMNCDSRTFAAVLVRKGHDLEKGESSRGTSGTSGEQPRSIIARAAKKGTDLAKGDILVSAGAGITPNCVVEGKLQLANLKQMLLSIREETNRWLGLLYLGLLWDEANHTASLRQSPIVNEMGLRKRGK